ncbi:hypothetical protein DUI87_10891 [Hirundo rustica rustica]|uniref:Uncharacterized protein n=1 Tax=Hirundo rustica rustica TaxID=333673 RepID=A0A3M0KJW9_HIRRU|nr:hypothetical protein DUI87_10891 [Hirundo rustica rustica]
MWRNVLALRQISQRTISTASRRQLENRVPENQKLFQQVKLGNSVCSLLSACLFNAQEAKLIPFEDASATNISLSSSHVTVVAVYYKQLA